MFYVLKFHKLCQNQTLIGSKYLSPYLDSVFSLFPRLFSTKIGQNQVICVTCVVDFYGDINKLISMLHVLISGDHSNNRVAERMKG